MTVTALCWECGEDLDPEVPEAHICWEGSDGFLRDQSGDSRYPFAIQSSSEAASSAGARLSSDSGSSMPERYTRGEI